MNIIVDSCFWIALYDPSDNDYVWANKKWEELKVWNKFLVPHPTMYEFINTKLMGKKDKVEMFRVLFKKRDLITRISDEEYKEEALQLALQPSKRTISLVDMTLRLMLEDDRIKKHAMLTLNVKDFVDVCRWKRIEMISNYEECRK